MRLFGTDGVRGLAGDFLTAELSFKLGAAYGKILSNHSTNSKVVIGKDTRISCDMLENSLASGLLSQGVDVTILGVVPTPAVAFITANGEYSAGIMISASHNAYYDNGIKFFDSKGYKLSDELENQIEALVQDLSIKNLTHDKPGKLNYENNTDIYINILKKLNILKKVVIDCANGATYKVAKQIFPQAIFINDSPNGVNINDNCGSTHMEGLVKKVLEVGADIGFAFDGDGDRCFAVDELGNIIDGDMIMSILSKDFNDRGELKGSLIATTMSNLSLSIFAKENGIDMLQADVGDRFVLEKMRETNSNLGGEQSGHIILLDYNTTGDGIATAVNLLGILEASGKKFSQINKLKLLPQVLINVPVSKEHKKQAIINIKEEIKEVENRLGEYGRVLVRASGTEDLVRVMVEGQDFYEITSYAKSLEEAILLDK